MKTQTHARLSQQTHCMRLARSGLNGNFVRDLIPPSRSLLRQERMSGFAAAAQRHQLSKCSDFRSANAQHNSTMTGLGFCGCRPGCKKFLTDWRSDRVRSSVRPQFAAFSEAAGRYGDQRIGSKSLRRTRGSEPKTGFPNPDLFDHFAHSGHRLLAPSYRFQIVSPVSSQAATVFAGSR